MKTATFHIPIFLLLIASAAVAQNTVATSATPAAAPAPSPAAVPAASPAASPAAGGIEVEAPAPAVSSQSGAPDAVAPAKSPASQGGKEIRLNFQGTPLVDVLNYLSEAAGFVIVQETPVSGTVNVISKQAVSTDDAIDLLNTVLAEKGYVAIRNGRILKIVSSHDAQKRDLPVNTGSDPDRIPKKDGMVTQILPIRYVEAGKLVDNIRALLSPDATVSANESSNSILLTDTQTNIHRIAEIIRALDTSVSSISTIRVFPLRYADAKDFAGVLTQLFTPDQSARNSQNNQNGPLAGFFGRFGGGRGGAAAPEPPQSEARQAASRVVAVADQQSNSVIVSAPDAYMETIAEIVTRLDVSISDISETRIFHLEHADATELSNILNSLYADNTTTAQNRGNGNQGQNNRNQRQPQQNNQNSQPSERSLLQARVVTVPDPRTNSLLVSASRDTMEQIALTIGRLDATDSKKQHVYVYTLEHADPDNVASILRGMFSSQNTTSTGQQPTSSALNQRTSTGASTDVTGVLNTSGNTGRSGGR